MVPHQINRDQPGKLRRHGQEAVCAHLALQGLVQSCLRDEKGRGVLAAVPRAYYSIPHPLRRYVTHNVQPGKHSAASAESASAQRVLPCQWSPLAGNPAWTAVSSFSATTFGPTGEQAWNFAVAWQPDVQCGRIPKVYYMLLLKPYQA